MDVYLEQPSSISDLLLALCRQFLSVNPVDVQVLLEVYNEIDVHLVCAMKCQCRGGNNELEMVATFDPFQNVIDVEDEVGVVPVAGI